MDIRGARLGLVASAIALTYTGGSLGVATRTYAVPTGACTVVDPGTLIRCPTLPGVGANYTFVVTVDGGSSAVGAGFLSYAPPIINSVEGPGAYNGLAAGGMSILLQGVRTFAPTHIFIRCGVTPRASGRTHDLCPVFGTPHQSEHRDLALPCGSVWVRHLAPQCLPDHQWCARNCTQEHHSQAYHFLSVSK